MPRAFQLALETLLVEAICLGIGWLVYWLLSLFTDDNPVALLFLLVISVVPALVYLAMRADRLPLSPSLAHDLAAGFLRGTIVAGGLIFTVWLGEFYTEPCRPYQPECFRYVTTMLTAGFGIVIILPAFTIITPLYGLYTRKTQREND